jgi:general secretion pathway protein A
MEYYHYFGLKGPPFQPASPHGAVYFSPTHLEGLATLESGLAGELSGLTLLTGEAGTGKTTLIYSLLQRDHKRVRIAHIDDPKLSFLEIMQSILTQMTLYSAGSTKLDYLNTLDHLLELRGKEERIAVVVDEAQVLSDDVLEELRLLSNRGQQRNDRCLQLILVGQPELAERLKKPELRQLNQRISSRGLLKPLTTAQAIMYVECRISAQGGKCSAIFEPGALNHLLRRGDGLPRKINMLCHNAMQAAFYAAEKKVTVKTAKKIAAEYHDSVGITHQRRNRRPLVVRALIAGSAIASLLLLGFVYKEVRSERRFKHTLSSSGPIEQTDRAVRTVKQARRTVEQSAVAGHPDSSKKPRIVSSLAPRPVELRTSFAPEAAAPTAYGSDVTVAAASAGTQKQTTAAADQRRHITIKYGDTLEKIAIRYFGSKSGINEIIGANPQLANINELNVGQIIYLPASLPQKAAQDQTATARPVSDAEDPADR